MPQVAKKFHEKFGTLKNRDRGATDDKEVTTWGEVDVKQFGKLMITLEETGGDTKSSLLIRKIVLTKINNNVISF